MPAFDDSIAASRFQRRTLMRASALGAAGLAATALLGCGGDEDDVAQAPAGGASAPAGGASASAVGTDPRYAKDPNLPYAYNFPEPTGKTPKAGGTLRVAATWDVATMDPTKSAAGGTITVPNLIYSRLLGIKGGPEMHPFKIEVEPQLAKSWERTPDGLTITFKLGPGVKWQNVAPLNGRAFVAADVKFAFERYAKEGVHQSYWVNADRIEAPDATTVRVVLKKPTPEFEIPLASRYQTLFPRELVDSGEIDKKPVGTGPMILKEATVSDKVVLAANPDYWRRKVLLEGAEFKVVPDTAARTASFRAKQIEYSYALVATKRDLDELLKTMPDLQVNIPPIVNNVIPFGMNLSQPKFQDVRVRRAISLAINRKEIVTLAYADLAEAALPVLPWTYLFDKKPTDVGPWVKFDLAESKKLLSAAGATDLAFTNSYYSYGSAAIDRLTEILINQFRAAGITMKGGQVDYTQFNSQWVGQKLPDVTTSGWTPQGFDANTYFYNHLHSKSPGNRWLIKDDQLDQWAEQQSVEINVEKRRELHKKIWDRDADQAYRPPTPTAYGFEVYQPWLRGIRFGGLLGASSSYYDWGSQIENAWLDK